jgi:hypothetical protein
MNPENAVMIYGVIFSLIILLIIVGILSSYNGNPIKGWIGIWCSISKYHQKQFHKINKDQFFCCRRCDGVYYEGEFENKK